MSLEDAFPDPGKKQLVVVSSYTRFDNLAHGPRGTEAKCSMRTFQLDQTDGQMVMLYQDTKESAVMNPAFLRFHPTKDVLYGCTESVVENGQLVSWQVDPATGSLKRLGSADARGTSTCYMYLDKTCRNMLTVNYWDSTCHTFGISDVDGQVGCHRAVYDPKEGRAMVAKADKHVNHSENDQSAQSERQADPHSHAIILDPYVNRIAYVPDLGKDLIRQLLFSPDSGKLEPRGAFPSGPAGRKALGPRYIDFHPFLPIVYVVNELSSEVSVFEFDHDAAKNVVDGGGDKATLRLVQTVSTLPAAFPGTMNTCGRICVHADGNFVLCSNRGHDSIAVFRVHPAHVGDPQPPGHLSVATIRHTRGATPRHFQFDQSGKWLISANQDSDSVSIFSFCPHTGNMSFSGHSYSVPSPNFVCCITPGETGTKRCYTPPQPQPSPSPPRSRSRSPRRK